MCCVSTAPLPPLTPPQAAEATSASSSRSEGQIHKLNVRSAGFVHLADDWHSVIPCSCPELQDMIWSYTVHKIYMEVDGIDMEEHVKMTVSISKMY
jgi:hypothetical protein